MIIKPNPMVSAFHGTASAAVAVRGKSANYLKQLTRPHNPNTPAQQAQRDAFRAAGAYWRSLPRSLQLAYGRGAIPI